MKRFARVTLLALVGAAGLPASALAQSSSLVVYSEPENPIIGGVPRLLTSSTDQIWPRQVAEVVEINAWHPNWTPGFTVRLAAPNGGALQPGRYDEARSWPGEQSAQPILDVSGEGTSCGSTRGGFVVKDVAYSPSGELKRLWATFVQRCYWTAAYLFGEVRFGMPETDAVARVLPQAIQWPRTYPERGGPSVPVTVMAKAALRVTGVTVDGPDAGDFPIVSDGCSGRTLASADQCQVWVRFGPTAGRQKSAELVIATAGGAARRVELAGLVQLGRTGLAMESGVDDWVGAGRSWSYGIHDADISIEGNGHTVRMLLRGNDGKTWIAEFEPPEGRLLQPGHFPGATRWSPAPSQDTRMSVVGDGRGCNLLQGDFTVHHAAYAPDGLVTQFGVSFRQFCDGAATPLTGRWDFHVGAPTDGSELGGSLASSGPSPIATSPPQRDRRAKRANTICGKRQLKLGTARGNRLRGTPHGDCLRGGAGNDVLRGGRGSDVLVGGPGRDWLDCGPGRDTAYATAGDTTRGCERVRRPR